MRFDFNWRKFLFGGKSRSSRLSADATMIEAIRPSEKVAPARSLATRGARFWGRYSVTKQLQILGGALLLLMLIIATVVFRDNQESTYHSAYIATAGDMRMLSQRLPKAASLAQQGGSLAFRQLRDSHALFVSNLDRLSNGGELAGTVVPPSPQRVLPQIEKLKAIWAIVDTDVVQLLEMESSLVALRKDVTLITETSSHLLELTEQVATLKLQTNASVREIAAVNQMVMLTQRIAKNASALLSADEISSEIAIMLGKDSNTFRELLVAQLKGNEALHIAATSDAEIRRRLGELEGSYDEYQLAVNRILASMQRLVAAKRLDAEVFRSSEDLLEATGQLAQAYQQVMAESTMYALTLTVLVILALLVLGAMAKIYLNETRRQALVAEKSRQSSELINRQNQDAILRLMNELGDLADGDLTVTATVSEDITGAIADSINYTIEELRVLVGRINNAAGRVTTASGIAQQTSAELLEAAKRQSVEIQAAGHSVLAMAESMTGISGDADQSARVARQSLAAAGKGTLAVEDSIKGMNEIRMQIQETSKRIKRLGESSQEIGEIVELISDITEQTNVLALNAAIQAASAGEAGRGFTVVAEEVQRLAERSGEATKQIAAIVKTIQTDTQGAVSAMEESTHGVVEGAKLSDAAGQALAEIGDVSKNLAELIAQISDATRHQADSATGVAGKMQDILRVTEQTTVGTQKTTSAVGELAGLATELKSSVAGFKVG
jgi:twitching motility protein PilJ